MQLLESLQLLLFVQLLLCQQSPLLVVLQKRLAVAVLTKHQSLLAEQLLLCGIERQQIPTIVVA